jgi:hypothetical protein
MIRFLPSVGIACLLKCASAFSPQGRSHHHTSLWSSSSSSSHASHPPSRLQLASRTNADPHRHPPPSRDRIASALLSLSVGLLAASAPMVVVAAAADDSGASIAANSKITTGGASTLQSGRVSVCGRFVFFFGGGAPISSLPHSPTHPHPNRSCIRSSLLRALSLTLSLRSRLLDDRDNPRRQPRQIRLQGG